MEMLILKGYVIKPSGTTHATHTVFSNVQSIPRLSEDFCKPMCVEIDSGPRYSIDSRYNYKTRFNKEEDLPMAALAAIQTAIKRHYGNGVDYVHIERI